MKAFLGEPLGAYILRVRLETAARLLRYSDLTVEQIAYSIGYEVPSSLSKSLYKSWNCIRYYFAQWLPDCGYELRNEFHMEFRRAKRRQTAAKTSVVKP
jgi:AraC-like DNA-binding protein